MIFGWLRRRRRRKLLASPFPQAWCGWLERVPHYDLLVEDEQRRLRDILRVLVAEKNWEGCSGLAMTDEVRVVIAAQAALLLLGLEHDYYGRVESILVHPTSFESVFEWRNPGGIVSEGVKQLGEAWYGGPVILAWDSAQHGAIDPRDGTNLVLHEFAHRLDFATGWINGTPPLLGRVSGDTWRRVMSTAYERLKDDAHSGRDTFLDPYGATDEAEFFAVVVETFFEQPLELQAEEPALYEILARYFGQDAAARARRRDLA